MLDDTRRPFRAAILQSGQATVGPFPRDGGPAAWISLASALNCTSSHSEVEFACVQRADALTIRSIVNTASLEFRPVNDNVTQRATPLAEARRAGSVAKVPLLAGSNGQEGMNLAQQYGITNFSSITQADLELFLAAVTGSPALIGQIEPLIDEIQGASPWFSLFQAGAQLYTEVVYQCVRRHFASLDLLDITDSWPSSPARW